MLPKTMQCHDDYQSLEDARARSCSSFVLGLFSCSRGSQLAHIRSLKNRVEGSSVLNLRLKLLPDRPSQELKRLAFIKTSKNMTRTPNVKLHKSIADIWFRN
jgi:hypothetical protein